VKFFVVTGGGNGRDWIHVADGIFQGNAHDCLRSQLSI